MQRDVFISHASEDKDSVVRPLAAKLETAGLRVWLDEFELRLGDSLRSKLDEGLSCSRFGVVVLSKAFFAKEWPRKELNALFAKESDGTKVVLPVWHEIDRDDVAKFSTMLVDKIAIRTSEGLDNVGRAILRAAGSTPTDGLFRVFSHEYATYQAKKGSPENTQVMYLSFQVSDDTASIDIDVQQFTDFDVKKHGPALVERVHAFQEPALELLCCLAGWTSGHQLLGRAQITKYGSSVVYNVDGGEVALDEWKSFEALLHLRGFQSERSIDRDYLDLYFIPRKSAYTHTYEPPLHDEEVRLTQQSEI